MYARDISTGRGMGTWSNEMSIDESPTHLGLRPTDGQSSALLKKLSQEYLDRQVKTEMRPNVLRNKDIEGSSPTRNRTKYKPKNYDFLDYTDVTKDAS